MRKVGKVLTTILAIAGSIVVAYVFLVTLLFITEDPYIAKSDDDFDYFLDGFDAYLDDDIDD